MRTVAIVGGLLLSVAVFGDNEAPCAQPPAKIPLTLQPVPGVGAASSPAIPAPSHTLPPGTFVAPQTSPQGRPGAATSGPAPSREITGVNFTVAGDPRSRELAGVDFIAPSDVRSREMAGVDFVASGDVRSRELTGVDFVLAQ